MLVVVSVWAIVVAAYVGSVVGVQARHSVALMMVPTWVSAVKALSVQCISSIPLLLHRFNILIFHLGIW